MKLTSIIGIAIGAAVALMTFTNTASATTLEINGVKQTGAVTVKGSFKAGTSGLMTTTGGAFINTCTEGTAEGTTSTFTGTVVSGPVSSLTFEKCTSEPIVVDSAGTLSLEWIKETTGTLFSSGAKVTVPSPFGRLTCTTNNTDLGTLSGVSSGTATLTLNGVLNCGLLAPSAKWTGTFAITSPLGLGVTS